MRVEMKFNDHGFARSIARIAVEIDETIKNNIAEATRRTAMAAKSFAPVDKKTGKYRKTGARLKTSIRAKIQGMTGVAGTEVEYAPYVEFGTGATVRVPGELKEYAMQFKGAGIRVINNPAQPYLYPAFFLNRDRLTKKTNRDIDSIFRRYSIKR